MKSDPTRLAEVAEQIRKIKRSDHPVVRLVRPDSYSPHEILFRRWADVPEPAKLSMLQDLVDWSGVSNRDMGHVLLRELDVGKLSNGERDMLIRLAVPGRADQGGKMSLDDLKRLAAETPNGQAKSRALERGHER